MSTLKEIATLLAEATGPSWEIDNRFHELIYPEHRWVEKCNAWSSDEYDGCYVFDADNYTSSIDAALALVERMLPKWYWEMWGEKVHDTGDGDCFGCCLCHSGCPDDDVRANAPTAPLAVLKALVAALIAKETTNE